MSKTYTMCQGMRGEKTARGGNDGCMAELGQGPRRGRPGKSGI